MLNEAFLKEFFGIKYSPIVNGTSENVISELFNKVFFLFISLLNRFFFLFLLNLQIKITFSAYSNINFFTSNSNTFDVISFSIMYESLRSEFFKVYNRKRVTSS